MRLRPVHSIKHIVDASGVVVAGTNSVVDLINTKDAPVTTSPNQVALSSKVFAVFLSVEIVGAIAYAGVPRVYFALLKNPAADFTIGDLSSLGDSDKRRFIVHQEMMMVAQTVGDGTAFPRTMFKGVVRLPGRLSRMGTDDKLQFIIGNNSGESTGSTRWCVQCIFKEFR